MIPGVYIQIHSIPGSNTLDRILKNNSRWQHTHTHHTQALTCTQYIYTHAHTCATPHTPHPYTHTHVHIHAHTYTHTDTRYTCACTPHTRTCTHVYTDTCMHIHTPHTRTSHTHTSSHLCSFLFQLLRKRTLGKTQDSGSFHTLPSRTGGSTLRHASPPTDTELETPQFTSKHG